jgi:TonB family protein
VFREYSVSVVLYAFATVAMVGCATSPEPTTHEAWLAHQSSIVNAIRKCDPDYSICHMQRARINQTGLCFQRDYPADAKRRGEEGKTLLHFDVTPAGRVSSVVVVRGSGYASLDEAAVKGMSQCKFPENLKSQTTSGSRLAVEYVWQLENGEIHIQRIPR